MNAYKAKEQGNRGGGGKEGEEKEEEQREKSLRKTVTQTRAM